MSSYTLIDIDLFIGYGHGEKRKKLSVGNERRLAGQHYFLILEHLFIDNSLSSCPLGLMGIEPSGPSSAFHLRPFIHILISCGLAASIGDPAFSLGLQFVSSAVA